jgi:hypothetical protein
LSKKEVSLALQRVKVTGIKQLNSKLTKEIRKILRDKTTRQSVGRIVVAGIRSMQKPVQSQVTIAFRKYYEKFNKTHPEYRRSNINITFTGDLLNDLQKNIKADFSGSKNEYVLEHSDKKHKKYKTAKKRKKKKSKTTEALTHQMISEYLIEKGYDYLQLDDKTINRVLRYINIRLKNQLSKVFK